MLHILNKNIDLEFGTLHACIFGFYTYVDFNDSKLEPSALKCIFIGYIVRVTSYRLWCIEEGKNLEFINNRDVTNFEYAIYE